MTALDYCFNSRCHSSISVSVCKKHSAAPPKFVQLLSTARAKLAKQRWSSIHDFCVGLAEPNVHVLASSGSKLWLGITKQVANCRSWKLPLHHSQYVCRSKLSSGSADHKRWPSVYGFSLTVANACWTVASWDDFFSPLQERSS